MYIIYHCVGGSHSSITASSIHLGLLPTDRKPSVEELLDVPFYDTLNKEDQGRIILRGIDEFGNKVFTLSRQFYPHLIIPAIQDAWELAGGNRKDLLIVNTMTSVNFIMKIGGFSSRRLKLVTFGRPIVARGTIKSYDKLLKIVKDTKDIISSNL